METQVVPYDTSQAPLSTFDAWPCADLVVDGQEAEQTYPLHFGAARRRGCARARGRAHSLANSAHVLL